MSIRQSCCGYARGGAARRRSLVTLALASIAGAAGAMRPGWASGDTLYWDPAGSGYNDGTTSGPFTASDGSNTWVNGTNNTDWFSPAQTNDVAWNNGDPDAAVIGYAATDVGPYAISLGSAIVAQGITFNAGPNYTISGSGANTLTLMGGGINVASGVATVQAISAPVVLGAAQTWNNSGTSVLTVSGAVGGSANLTTYGTINLSGGSTFTGNLTVAGGTLSAGGGQGNNTAGALGNSSSGHAVTVGAGGTLVFNINNLFGGSSLATRPSIVLNGGSIVSNAYNAIGPITLNNGATLTSTVASAGYAGIQFGPTVTAGGTAASTIGGTGYFHLAASTDFAVPDVTASSAVDLTINSLTLNPSSDFGGTGSLVKDGAGTLAMNSSSATGTATVNAGVLQLTANYASSGYTSYAFGSVIVNAAGTLQLTGTHAFGFNQGTRPNIVVNGGTVDNSGGSDNYLGPITMVGGSIISSASGGNRDFRLQANGGSTYTFTTNASSSTAIVSVPNLQLVTSNAVFSVASGTTGSGDDLSIFSVASGTTGSGVDLSISSVISGTGLGITKTGAGTLSLSGANTYTGPTNLAGGSVRVGVPNGYTGAFGYTSGVTINAGTTVTATNDNAYVGGGGQNVPTTINAGGTLNGSSGVSDHLGGLLTLNGGTLATAGVNSNYYGGWNLDRGLAVTASSTLAATNVTLNQTGGTSFNVASGATLNVTGTLTKVGGTTDTGMLATGAGTIVLAGANTYAAGTTITGGKVLATNATSSLGVGPVTVGDGANASTGVLGGTGAVGNGANALTVRLGGTITAGSGIGSADTTGNLSTGAQAWNGGGTYVAKLDATNRTDTLIMSGLTVSATSTSQFIVDVVTTTGAGTPVGTYVLAVDRGVAYTPGVDPFMTAALQLQVNNVPVPSSQYTLTDAADITNNGGTDLVLTAAPEPTSLLLMAAVAAPGLLGRRRASRRRA